MPAIHGMLYAEQNDYDLDKALPVAVDRTRFFDTSAALPDQPANPHNLALDPVSIALARAMGFSWLALARLAGVDDEGISVMFDTRSSALPDTLVLPDNHPCVINIDPTSSGVEDIELVACGNHSAHLVLAAGVTWDTVRVWPEGSAGDYVDWGTISLARTMPQSVIDGLNEQAREGRLRFSDVLVMPGLDLDPPFHDVLSKDGWTMLRIKFLSTGGGYSMLPPENA